MNKKPTMILGIFLLNCLWLPVIIASIFFIVGGVITPAVALIALVVAIIINIALYKEHKKEIIILCLIGICIVVISILVCGYSFDWGYDSNTYHKSVAGLLADGWNPLKMTFYEFASKYNFLQDITEPWYDSYPKATEIFQAVIYSLTNNIEMGKAYNIISIFSAFFICYSYIDEIKYLKKIDSIFLSIICAMNPVILIQSLTAYNDGFLWELVLLFGVALVYITLENTGKYKDLSFYIIFATVSLGLNVKYSGLLFFGMLGISIFLYEIYKVLSGKMQTDNLRQHFWVLLGAVLSGLLIIGSNSYIINIFRHGNPLYVMVGKGAIDIITPQTPIDLVDKPGAVQFLMSLFSKAGGSGQGAGFDLKVPFTFSREELSMVTRVDTRLGGWGVLFSGIILICIPIIFFLTKRFWKVYHEGICVSILVFSLIVLQIIFVPGMFWARYFCMIFYMPVYTVLLCLLYYRRNNKKIFKRIAIVVILLYIANLIPAGLKNIKVLSNFSSIEQEVLKLQKIDQESDVVFEKSLWFGRFYNLIDYGITDFEFAKEDSETIQYNMVFSQEYGILYSEKKLY